MVNLSLFLEYINIRLVILRTHINVWSKKKPCFYTSSVCHPPPHVSTLSLPVLLAANNPATQAFLQMCVCVCVCPSSDTTAVHPTLLLIYAHVCDCVYVCECVSVPWRSAVGVKRSVSAFQYTSDPRDYCILQPRQRMCNSVYVQKSLNLPVKDS